MSEQQGPKTHPKGTLCGLSMSKPDGPAACYGYECTLWNSKIDECSIKAAAQALYVIGQELKNIAKGGKQ